MKCVAQRVRCAVQLPVHFPFSFPLFFEARMHRAIRGFLEPVEGLQRRKDQIELFLTQASTSLGCGWFVEPPYQALELPPDNDRVAMQFRFDVLFASSLVFHRLHSIWRPLPIDVLGHNVFLELAGRCRTFVAQRHLARQESLT